MAEYSDILVVIEHPYATAEVPLDDWMETGPGYRPLLRPVGARDRRTGKPLPLSVIPLRYRNNFLSRLLIALGLMKNPWGHLGKGEAAPPAEKPKAS
jgi:hypothetical protein